MARERRNPGQCSDAAVDPRTAAVGVEGGH